MEVIIYVYLHNYIKFKKKTQSHVTVRIICSFWII